MGRYLSLAGSVVSEIGGPLLNLNHQIVTPQVKQQHRINNGQSLPDRQPASNRNSDQANLHRVIHDAPFVATTIQRVVRGSLVVVTAELFARTSLR